MYASRIEGSANIARIKTVPSNLSLAMHIITLFIVGQSFDTQPMAATQDVY
jgi:hypothetical protein